LAVLWDFKDLHRLQTGIDLLQISCPGSPLRGRLRQTLGGRFLRSDTQACSRTIEFGEQLLTRVLVVGRRRLRDRAVFVEPVEHLQQRAYGAQLAVLCRPPNYAELGRFPQISC